MHSPAKNLKIHSTSLFLPTAKVTLPSENNADSLHGHKLGRVFGPCDFYLWGSLKYKVYKTNSHTLEELRYNIHSEISTTSGELQRVINVFCSCIECIQAGSQHFQHLL